MKKIIISSDPHGRFDLLLPKIHELHNKNKFDFMLIVGVVCPSSSAIIFDDLRNRKITFPLPTYYVDDSNMSKVFSSLHSEGFEVVPNLYYMGNIGVKQIQGIKIVYLSGSVRNTIIYDQDSKKQGKFNYTKEQAKFLVDFCENKQVDILLTNQWAEEYQAMEGTNPCKSQIVSQICFQLSPRYHISGSGQKYLRLPAFKGRKGNPTHFINVAEIKQAIPKDKYLVAIQMNPQVPQLIENMPANILVKSVDWNVVDNQKPSQLLQAQNRLLQVKNKNEEQKIFDQNSFLLFDGFPEQTPNSQITQFLQKWGEVKQIEVFKKLKGNKKAGIVRFKNLKDAQICLKDSGKYSLYQSRIKFEIKQQNEKYRLKDCFLCYGNQKFENNLIVYKGKFCFISVDKGPVTDFHFQIVPINHVSSTGQLEYEEQQQLSQFKNLYQNYFTNHGYTLVCIERYMNLSAQINHAILHCIPIKKPEGEVVAKFKQVNYQNKFGFEQLGQNKNPPKSDTPYYILVSVNGHKFIKNVERKDRKFEQGRQIVCEILEKPQRLNWRDCEIPAEKIKQVVQQLKKAIV